MPLQKQKYIDGSPVADYTLPELLRSYTLVLTGTPDVEISVTAPIGWRESPFTMERTENHGVIVKRGREGDEIGFYTGNGKTQLDAFYAQKGPDGDAFLIERVFERGSTDTLAIYTARLDFSMRRIEGEIIFLGISRNSVRDLLLTRWDTMIDLQTSNTVDGITYIDDAPARNLALDSIALKQSFKNERNEVETADWAIVYQGNTLNENWFVTLNTTLPQLNEIQTQYGYPLAVSGGPPNEIDKYDFKMLAEGNYRFELDINIGFDCRLYKLNAFSSQPNFNPWNFRFWLQIGNNKIQIGNTVGGGVNSDELGLKGFSATYDQMHLIKTGEAVYMYGQFEFISNHRFKRVEAWVRSYHTKINISAITRTANSGTKSILIGDALKYLVQSATDKAITAKSDFYTGSGCGANRVLFHGFWLRNGGNYLEKPFRMSIADLLESKQAIDCAGWNLEWDEATEKEVLRVEPVRYFYRDEEIMSFEVVTDIGDKTDKSLLYRKIKIGYENYSDEGEQALEDFNTLHSYQTPLKYAEADYERVSKIAASGILIEKVRRLQFDPENKTASSEDERVFVVCVKEASTDPVTMAVSFGEPYEKQWLEEFGIPYEDWIPTDDSFLLATKPDMFAVGAVIAISGTTQNNKNVTVTDVKFIADLNVWAIKVAEVIPQELDTTATFTPVTVPLIAENDEFFDVSAGLSSPETAINLRINPKYMLMAHSPIVNSGLAYKGAGANLSLRDCKQNNFLTLQRLNTDPCYAIDPDRSVVTMGANIALGELMGFFTLFSPESATITVDASYEQAVYLCNAHINRAAEANYGYVSVRLPDTTTLKYYVRSMDFSETDGKMTLNLVKKKS